MLDELTRLYDAYVDTFREADGKLPAMMRLKRIHTAFVVKNAELISDGEGFTPEEREVALAAALLHDTGRYEQLRRYNTFQDSKSVDHAVFSHDIVKEKGWLDAAGRVDFALRLRSGKDSASPLCKPANGEPRRPANGEPRRPANGEAESFPLVSAAQKDAILKAVLYHNRRDLPDGLETPLFDFDSQLRLTHIAAHTVRDADKLDIFRVLEDQVAHTDWRSDSRAFWNLAVSAPPNPVVVDCIASARPVDYQHIQSLSDFVLIQVGWMICGLHFATSRRLCRERGHLAYRRDFLHQLTESPDVDRLCDQAERALA